MSYDKGARGERELLEMFYEEGFVGLRAPSSGSTTDRELPDLLVGNSENFYAIEAKRKAEDKVYLPHDEVEDLAFFAEMFGAEPIVAYRKDRSSWKFWRPYELYDAGKNYRVTDNEEAMELQDLI